MDIPESINMFNVEGTLIDDILDIDACALLVINNPKEANEYFKSISPIYSSTGVLYVFPEFEEMVICAPWNTPDGSYSFTDITLCFEALSKAIKNYPDQFKGE